MNTLTAQEEQVAYIKPEDDHRRPAEIADQWFLFDSPSGTGRGAIPVAASHFIHGPQSEITDIYVVQHGVCRNATEYLRWFEEAISIGKDAHGNFILPPGVMVVAPQFLAQVDIEASGQWDLLRWGYNDWRGAEPAQNKDNPISSFEAMDALLDLLYRKTPNLERVHLRGNSEGGQLVDRYLAFGKELRRLEEYGIQVEGLVTNPGSVLYFDEFRPPQALFDAENLLDHKLAACDVWDKVFFNSRANEWPLGLYNLPPYVSDIIEAEDNLLDEVLLHGVEKDYLRRVTLSVGRDDSDPRASQLPTGPGLDEQGPTRLHRVAGKWHHAIRLARSLEVPHPALITVNGVGHKAVQAFVMIETFRGGPERFHRFANKARDVAA